MILMKKQRSVQNLIAADLKAGKLEDEWVTIEVTEQNTAMFDMMPGMGMDMGSSGMQDMLSSLMPKKKKKRKMKVKRCKKSFGC
ncbi:ATP-dependent protease ATPase subunit HslU [Ureibacillus acetophenoni]